MSEQQSSPVESTWIRSLGFAIVMLVIGLAAFYIGGWHVIWGKSLITIHSLSMDALYMNFNRGIAFRVNTGYYGLLFDSRFFSSPVLSWLCCAIGVSCLSSSVRSLFRTESAEAIDE